MNFLWICVDITVDSVKKMGTHFFCKLIIEHYRHKGLYYIFNSDIFLFCFSSWIKTKPRQPQDRRVFFAGPEQCEQVMVCVRG